MVFVRFRFGGKHRSSSNDYSDTAIDISSHRS